MNTAEWLARRAAKGQPPVPYQQPAPQQYQQPAQQPWQGQQYVPQAPGLAPQLPQDGRNGVPVDDAGMVHVMDAVGAWRGGVAHRTETQGCPECGDTTFYFTRDHPNMRKNGAPPAPFCHRCGFNGRFEQFGTQPLDPKAPVIN